MSALSIQHFEPSLLNIQRIATYGKRPVPTIPYTTVLGLIAEC
jgi:hypothetical protein